MLSLVCVFGMSMCIRLADRTIQTEAKECSGNVWGTRECARFTGDDGGLLRTGDGDAIGRRWGDVFFP